MRITRTLSELSADTRAAEAIKRWLVSEGVGDDQELIADTIEGETNLHESLESVVALRYELVALKAAAKLREQAIKDRRADIDKRIASIDRAILAAMDAAGVSVLEGPEGQISRRRVPIGMQIVSLEKLPAKFWVTPEPDPVPDKRAIKDALKSGEEVPGAELTNGGETLSFRGGVKAGAKIEEAA